ncbi:MAG: glycosyltransferase [Propionibacteriaceae bacterium]|jgi:galactofuranosylgalactofuranosylrhamnosyl-N-acetylglucosaminyl-diphospho-decaprenol beta-1,5/1,6-galactofuranosyltransferase|nr:glycosyltransferase [Propionibacteriaceae bacterium]
MTTTSTATKPMRVLQRVVFPLQPDQDIMPLYAEGRQGASAGPTSASNSSPAPTSALRQGNSQVLSRRCYKIKALSRTSFGTYFNAFPAAYWRKWTTVTQVRLSVTVTGSGSLFVYRSNARGNLYRIESERFTDAAAQELVFTLPLSTFADGGWYWFDIVAGDDDIILERAQWEAPSERPQGTVTIGVTTLNRPDDVVALLKQIAADDHLLDIVDRVTIVDQGTKHPDDAEGFDEAEAALGGRLRMIRQANLGGSGGFSRGMSETIDEGVSTYHLVSDDDVRTEPEGILRAVAFADLARRPTVVGGHMFSMFDRCHLHSMGEKIQPWRFWWGPVMEDFPDGHHLDLHSLRSTPELHRRIDVDYNGWWMELIPVTVLRQLGLSLPFFIKWDDAEYGLRAKTADIPTVSLPGVAAWHVPWTDKDDSLDWQAYYHERNRFVSALLHSPFHYGGRLVRESLYHQIRHLLSAQYSVAELRNEALEDLLGGPEHMHAELDTRLARIRATRSEYDDARVTKDPGAFPPVRRKKVSKHGDAARLPTNRVGIIAMAGLGAVKALLPPKKLSRQHPEAEIAAMDARWWLLARFDSSVVSTADGSGAAWYKRQPQQFRALFARSLELHQQLLREWPRLAKQYRQAQRVIVGQAAWKQTFERTDAVMAAKEAEATSATNAATASEAPAS